MDGRLSSRQQCVWSCAVQKGEKERERERERKVCLTTEILQDQVELSICLKGVIQVNNERMLHVKTKNITSQGNLKYPSKLSSPHH